MNYIEIIGLIGSIISIVSAIFAALQTKRIKRYSSIVYRTDTKVVLEIAFSKLESIQETLYRYNTSDTRGINKDKELVEYENLRSKLNVIINAMPSEFTLLINQLKNLQDGIDLKIEGNSIMNNIELHSFKKSIPDILGELKKELECLKTDLIELSLK